MTWKIATGILAAGFIATAAHADAIVVSPLTNNESDIINLGNEVVSAANFGSAAGGNTTVDINGIVHQVASAANNGTGSDLLTNATINSSFDGNYRSANAGGAGYTGDMLDLMGGIAGVAEPGPIAIVVNGLTPGEKYLFQGYWEANNFNQTVSVVFEDTDSMGGITGQNGLGTLISYTFVAGDGTFDAALSKTGGDNNIWWQGFSLQVVPEPASLALLGLGSLMILRRRNQ